MKTIKFAKVFGGLTKQDIFRYEAKKSSHQLLIPILLFEKLQRLGEHISKHLQGTKYS